MYRGSAGTIGDMFFTSHYMYHHSLRRKIFVVLPSGLNPSILELYNPEHQHWIDRIIFMPDHSFQDDTKYLELCAENDCEPNRYMIDIGILKDATFHPLSEWFRYNEEPTFKMDKCIGLQIMSSGNWHRPRIPHIGSYLNLIWQAGYHIVLIGGQSDADNLLREYPEAMEWIEGDQNRWRFGKDTILQTMANVRELDGMVVFSSWTAYAAVFQGVPTIELWARDQWQFFTRLVDRMLGSPVHYIQDAFDVEPTPYLFSQILPSLRKFKENIYDFEQVHERN